MRKAGFSVTVFISGLCLTGTAWGFGSMIAVGVNAAADVEPASTPFSADAILETSEHTINTKIYYKPGHARDEITMGGQDMVVLQDIDAGKFYMLMPQGMYMEVDSGSQNEQLQEYKLIERTVVGREKVNDFDTTKYKVIYEGPDGKYGGFTWFTDDNIAVQAFMVSETKGEKERVRFQITELRRGEQPDSLFTIPSNYRKFDMGGFGMSSMMGGAMGGQSGMPEQYRTQAQPAPAARAATPSSPPAPGGDGVLKMVQENLTALGYNTGNTDGIESTETTIAISQFQAEKGMEVTGKASPQLAGILAAEAGGGAAPARDPAELQAAQQACLQQKMQAAQESQKKKRGFGRLMNAASRIAGRTGNYDLARTTRDVYDANATADDLAAAAKDLGLTQSDIEACQNPF